MIRIVHVPWSSYSKKMKALYVFSALLCVASSAYQVWVARRAGDAAQEYYNTRMRQIYDAVDQIREREEDEDALSGWRQE